MVIPIFFAVDQKYLYYLDVAIRSLVENASDKYDYEIKVLYQGLTDEQLENIKRIAWDKDNVDIDLIYMDKGLESITDREENRLRLDHFTLSIYFRLFIAEMFPEFDKGIYIDSDTVIPGDISELYNVELGDNIIGASVDFSCEHVPELMRYFEYAVGVPGKEYINSGVLLMNLKQMREKEFSKNFLRLLNKYHFDSVAPDQDYINAMCYGKILYLDKCWDAMPAKSEPLANPKLIHYNLFQKPWCYDGIQYEEYFWKYAMKSIYHKELANFKKNYSKEDIKFDEESFEYLIEKAKGMEFRDVTFKKVYDKGEKIRI